MRTLIIIGSVCVIIAMLTKYWFFATLALVLWFISFLMFIAEVKGDKRNKHNNEQVQ